jgi:hypothetical protein
MPTDAELAEYSGISEDELNQWLADGHRVDYGMVYRGTRGSGFVKRRRFTGQHQPESAHGPQGKQGSAGAGVEAIDVDGTAGALRILRRS